MILEGKFVEGLLIGIGVGVTSSIILGTFHWIRRRLMRHEQVKHLKQCIIGAFSRIQSHAGLQGDAEGAPSVNAEQLRPMFLEGFLRDIKVAVNYRTTALTADQIFDLQRCLAGADAFVIFTRFGVRQYQQSVGQEITDAPGTGLPLDINFYRNIYKMFVEIKWLRLSEEMPTEM